MISWLVKSYILVLILIEGYEVPKVKACLSIISAHTVEDPEEGPWGPLTPLLKLTL